MWNDWIALKKCKSCNQEDGKNDVEITFTRRKYEARNDHMKEIKKNYRILYSAWKMEDKRQNYQICNYLEINLSFYIRYYPAIDFSCDLSQDKSVKNI